MRGANATFYIVHKMKENPRWFGHHRTGMNYSEGDSMKYIDQDDANVTFEYAWNITKYFTVWSDCWLDGCANIIDSDDDDYLVDTVIVSFNAKSILPHDLAMINFSLIGPITLTNYSNNAIISKYMNISVNRS